MIPASLNMPIMSNGEAVAPPELMKWDANSAGGHITVNPDLLTVKGIGGNPPVVGTVNWYGHNVLGNSQKSTGKWQYTVKCTVTQGGGNSAGEQTFANFGISKKHRWAYGTLGKASYDYCIVSYDAGNSVENMFKESNATQTLLYSGAGSSYRVDDYATILVDFDAGKIWFAINGTVLEGDPNAGTGESFSFTPNTGFVPCCTLATAPVRTAGTYVLQESIIYPTWSSFQLWDKDEQTASDDEAEYDINHADTSLIWIADGLANGTTSLTDSSPDAHTITNNLATVNSSIDVLNALVEPCGNGSLTFDGNDAFTITPVTEFIFGTGNFTIEFYMRRNGNPSAAELIYECRNSAAETNIPYIQLLTNGTVRLRYSGTNILTSLNVVCDNRWHHIAVSRDSGNLRLFVDGVQQRIVTGVGAVSYNATALRFGCTYDLNGYFTGSLNFIRVTKGVARYTSSFRPPRFWLAT